MKKTIVITGSTRGFGYSMAEAFLGKSCTVVISGRTMEAVNEAVTKLREKYDEQQIMGKFLTVSFHKRDFFSLMTKSLNFIRAQFANFS